MGGVRGQVEWGKLVVVIALLGGAAWYFNRPSATSARLNAKPDTRAPVAKPPPPPPPTPARTRTFARTPCTYDCSGHQAGYDWAEEHGIDDPDDCGGNSQSFIEGCEEYAEEQAPSSAIEDDEQVEESEDDGE